MMFFRSVIRLASQIGECILMGFQCTANGKVVGVDFQDNETRFEQCKWAQSLRQLFFGGV